YTTLFRSIITGESLRALGKLLEGLADGILLLSELIGVLAQPADDQELHEALLDIRRRPGRHAQQIVRLGLDRAACEVIIQFDEGRQVMGDVSAATQAEKENQKHRSGGERHG